MKYLKTKNGWKCAVCEAERVGPFARQDALVCYYTHHPDQLQSQPGRRPYGEPFNEDAWRAKNGLPQAPPPSPGHTPNPHFRERKPRRDALARQAVEYLRALKRAESLDYARSVERFVREIFEPDGGYPKWRGKTSPLQRLAYAYTAGLGWDAVKSAAINLAYDALLRKRIDDYMTRITDIAKLLDGYLTDLEKEALQGDELDLHSPGDPGIN